MAVLLQELRDYAEKHKVSDLQNAKRDVIPVVKDVVQKIESYDSKFKIGEIEHTGSIYQKLKIDDPDEFDFDLPLKELEIDKVTNISQEYAKYQLKAHQSVWNHLADAHGSLSSERVLQTFASYVRKAVNDLNREKRHCFTFDLRTHHPAVTLKFLAQGVVRYNVDLVPTIKVKKWPDNLTKGWESRSRNSWPSVDILNGIKLRGVSLVPKLPRGMNTAERDIAWRYSFNEAEKVLLLDSQAPIANNCRRPVLRILKSLQKDYKWAGIRSYHLKTVLLHEFESHHPRDWTSKNMFQCLKKALERLRDFLQSKKCPHYFLPGINLFKTLSEQHRTKIIRDIKNFFDYPKGALEKLNGKASTAEATVSNFVSSNSHSFGANQGRRDYTLPTARTLRCENTVDEREMKDDCICFVFLFILVISAIASVPPEQNIRLVNEDDSIYHEGFVEVYRYGFWSKVSNVRWDSRNDIVTCKQLGFADVGNKPNIIPKYQWNRSFTLKHFFCQGAERTIYDCEQVDIEFTKRRTYAKTGNEVWVSCANEKDNAVTEPNISLSSGLVKDIQVRLVNNATDQSKPTPLGVLEIKVDEKWQHVCADGWTEANSHVACGHLGYTRALGGSHVPDAGYLQSILDYVLGVLGQNKMEQSNAVEKGISPVSYGKPPHHVMANVKCNGTELSLLSCEHAGFAKYGGCTSPVVLHCESVVTKEEDGLNIRLRGGQLPSEGRVEVFRTGIWGTVCHNDWDINDANVVCKQLGYGTARKAVRWGEYGQGIVPISMSNVHCSGTEATLTDCKFDIPRESCNHFKDAGVQCNFPNPQSPKVRLADSRNEYEGRVEVYHLGRWFSICGLQFTDLDGEVVCRELGLGFVGTTFSSWEYGLNDIGIYELGCSGDEQSILKCQHRPWFQGSCRYYDMAIVKCSNYAPDILMDVDAMRSSIKIDVWPLRQLSCSKSENCLTTTAYRRDSYTNPKTNTRRLMVFTSLILNKGTAAFRPNKHKDQWEWHQCHKHFHSMEYFARYDVIDVHGRKVAEGHKASFCLEDSQCEKGLKKMYNCTDKGDQGISVGCADNYANSIDCQWVDVTDIEDGNYTLMVHLNPSRLIVESDYSNNVASCEVHYHNSSVTVGECSAEPCKQRSYGGTGYGMCCHFPFVHKGLEYHSCVSLGKESQWCSTTYSFDTDKKWGYCSEQL